MNRNFMLAFAAAALFAARPASAADSPEANKKLVLDFFRVVFEARNIAAVDQYLSEDYLQHNPLVATGRKGFTDYFGPKWKTPKPVKPELAEPPAAVIAEGDLVVLMWKVKRPEPKNESKLYESFWFDAFRVKDGKLVEHWDNAIK